MKHQTDKFSGKGSHNFNSSQSTSGDRVKTQINKVESKFPNLSSTKLRDREACAERNRDRNQLIFKFPSIVGKGLFWGVIFSLTALISATFGASLTVFTPLSSTWSNNWSKKQQQELQAKYPFTKPVNILLLSSQSANNSIILLNFNPDNHYLQMEPIAKDSPIDIPGIGVVKIEDAIKADNDPMSIVRVVSQSMDRLPIDGYLRLDSQSELTEEEKSDRVKLEKTYKQLKSLRQHFQNPQNIARLSEAIDTTNLKIDTNLNRDEIVTLAIFLGSLEVEDLRKSLKAFN
jgi:anionic cell wall polymer biosynthesis LytR-Cps2A-Psr (LCP) family protein